MLVRCNACGKDLQSEKSRVSCGCSNMTTVHGDTVSAVNLSEILLINTTANVREAGHLTKDQLEWQEQRRKRRIRKLTYEER